HPRRFRARDLADAWLVHVATGDAGTDSRVVELCERRRVICISAGNGEHGSARMTAQLNTGDVTVAVASTHGADPLRSAAVRDAIDDLIATGSLPLRRRRPGRSG